MSQFPPVGDIRLTKAANTYNTYKMELSFGQLEVIRAALEAKHAEPIADELLAMFDYYMRELPGPGEEKEDKSQREAGAEAAEEDFPIPMPPGQETAEPADDGGMEGDGDGDLMGETPTGDLPGLPGGEEGTEGGPSGSEEDEPLLPDLGDEAPEETADRHLPNPPAE